MCAGFVLSQLSPPSLGYLDVWLLCKTEEAC